MAEEDRLGTLQMGVARDDDVVEAARQPDEGALQTLHQPADRIDLGGTIWIGIATDDRIEFRRSRILGGREWVRLGAVELALDCLRRFLQGLPVVERIDFEKV